MEIPLTIASFAPDGQLSRAQRRRLLIEICRRRVKPGTGSSYEFLHRRTAMYAWPDLRPILAEFAWAVTGAVATRAYMPERTTKDLAILVHQRDGQKILERLQAVGYQLISSLTIPGFALQAPAGTELDLILGDYAWLEEALTHPQHDVAGYPVLDLPYLVLMKLEASRTQDLSDLSRMLGLATETDLERVRTVVHRYASEAGEDLESLIYLGQLELKTQSTATNEENDSG